MTSAATLAVPATDPRKASWSLVVARWCKNEPSPARTATRTLAMSTAFQAELWEDQRYLACHFGGRFSANAMGPSMASAEENTTPTASALIFQPSASGSSAARFMTLLE
jgi:hypothetical protein